MSLNVANASLQFCYSLEVDIRLTIKYSRTSLYRSSGDRRDNFDITEVRYNRYLLITIWQLAGTWERLRNNREFDIKRVRYSEVRLYETMEYVHWMPLVLSNYGRDEKLIALNVFETLPLMLCEKLTGMHTMYRCSIPFILHVIVLLCY
jgi:hypothetical protein